jgi:hypothetical protein
MGASIIAMGAYMSAEPIPETIKGDFFNFLKEKTKIPSDYIEEMEKTGYFPGTVETNYSRCCFRFTKKAWNNRITSFSNIRYMLWIFKHS